ncbi:MAG: phospholipid carrier-dependent glycosyltransferase, partial [Candidatus Paceibacterota bacterium]
KYLALRFLPSLAGSLLPAVIFLLALQLGFSRRSAFVAGILIALENGLLVQTRFILMDGFLLLFGFLSLLFYFKYKNYLLLTTRYLLLSGVFAGLAISIKWTGLSFLALPLIIEFRHCIINRAYARFIIQLLFLILIPFVVYFSVFALHFSLLSKPGPGDAYMTQEFHDKNMVVKFTELNWQMYESNQRLTSSHPYSSQWYSWPFMARPIFYWVQGDARIYYLGNPVVWWASTVAILFSIILLLSEKLKVKSEKLKFDKILYFLLGGYLLNLLPFIGIGRVMFLYHYMVAMVFAVMMLVYVIEKIYSERRVKIILTGLVLVSFASFLYFAPLSYGLKLSPKEYEKRVLLPGWK